MQKALRWLAVGWLLGIVTFWTSLTVTDSMYEYRIPVEGDDVRVLVNQEGWVPISEAQSRFTFRRSRFRLP